MLANTGQNNPASVCVCVCILAVGASCSYPNGAGGDGILWESLPTNTLGAKLTPVRPEQLNVCVMRN